MSRKKSFWSIQSVCMLTSLEPASASTFSTRGDGLSPMNLGSAGRTTVPSQVGTQMVTECAPPGDIGHAVVFSISRRIWLRGWWPRHWGGGCIPTLRKAFKARIAVLSSKQSMCCPVGRRSIAGLACSFFRSQLPRAWNRLLQVAPQPSKEASVLMVR